MNRRMPIAAAILIACLARGPAAAFAQSSHLLIVVGLAGDPEHGELFDKWAKTLAATAADRLHVPKDQIQTLSGDGATKAEVARALTALQSAGPDDTVMIVLFGHGTFDGSTAKFNLPGPDMTPRDFAPLLAKLQSKRVVLVNTASASGPFVDALSAPGRVIVAATSNGAEKYATLFGGPFVDAFSNDAADANRDGTVTILEAFEFAKQQVEASFQREGIMQTEHARIDDTSRAALVSLGAGQGRAFPADPKLRALYVERQQLEQRIESLKLLKSGMDPGKYAAELERLATELAEKSRQIREAEGKGK
ncbi:MAG TPA: C13 family peptidase [Vicinamibacterales bacterium]|nr:C13 family peptidase [Vicinamibacterales bacterium]